MAEVPFASRPDVQNLDENEIIVRSGYSFLRPLSAWRPCRSGRSVALLTSSMLLCHVQTKTLAVGLNPVCSLFQ
jgi:hypothetical protein